MYSTETRIFGINPIILEQKLLSLGAIKMFQVQSTSIFFTHNVNTDTRCLRLSQDNGEYTLTFKGKVDDEIKDEFLYHSIKVSNVEKTKLLLESLGFAADLLLVKKRKTFMLNKVKIDIDKYSGSFDHVPYLIEIKAKDTSTLHNTIELLKLNKNDCCSWDLAQIDEHFSKE